MEHLGVLSVRLDRRQFVSGIVDPTGTKCNNSLNLKAIILSSWILKVEKRGNVRCHSPAAGAFESDFESSSPSRAALCARVKWGSQAEWGAQQSQSQVLEGHREWSLSHS